MAQKVTLKVSAAAARFLRADAPREEKLKAARAEVPLTPADLLPVLFFFSHGTDGEIRDAALKSLREMPETVLLELAASPSLHPQVLSLLARLHFMKPAVAETLAGNPALDEETLAFLVGKGVPAAIGRFEEAARSASSAPPSEGETPEKEGEEVDEESEEFKSKYQLYQTMGVAEKIKTALTGDKEWRNLLIKDSNKLVTGAVIKNPRITDAEVLTITKSKVQNDEILRLICMNKEWVKNSQIRKALVENSKTPLPFALRFLNSLTEKDLISLAKSKNVSTVIAAQARKIVMAKQQK